MNGIDRAHHLTEAARQWAVMATTRRHVAEEAGAGLEALGQLLGAAQHLERARETIAEALDLWGKAGLGDDSDRVRTARSLAAEIEAASADLDREFGTRCNRVVEVLEADGDPEDVLEARELAALNHERLAQGGSLGDLHEELSGPSCGCCSRVE